MVVPNWRDVLKHAWSVRIMLVAVVLSGAEAVVPYLDTLIDISPKRFAAIMFFVSMAALAARFAAQKKITGTGISPNE